MSDNKIMIRFYFGLFLVLALLAYTVDLNSQFHFVALNTPFISNSFCFAILSGILTGVIVAMATEIRQYLLHKRQARNSLYAIVSELYALISVQKASIKYYINHQDISIPENIGGDYAQQPILTRVSQFRAIDYATFSKKDDVRIALKSFRKQIDMIESTTRNLVNLKIARNEVQITFLEKCDNRTKVTASSPVMLNALHKEHNALKECLISIDGFCSAFEKIDSEKFSWKQGKKAVDEISNKIQDNVYFKPEQKE